MYKTLKFFLLELCKYVSKKISTCGSLIMTPESCIKTREKKTIK